MGKRNLSFEKVENEKPLLYNDAGASSNRSQIYSPFEAKSISSHSDLPYWLACLPFLLSGSGRSI